MKPREDMTYIQVSGSEEKLKAAQVAVITNVFGLRTGSDDENDRKRKRKKPLNSSVTPVHVPASNPFSTGSNTNSILTNGSS